MFWVICNNNEGSLYPSLKHNAMGITLLMINAFINHLLKQFPQWLCMSSFRRYKRRYLIDIKEYASDTKFDFIYALQMLHFLIIIF